MLFGINRQEVSAPGCASWNLLPYECLKLSDADLLYDTCPLVVLNVSTANTTNTAVLQQSMHQASVLPNYLVTLMGPLLQHTDSTYTFEDTEHFRLSLLLFCQQVATEERSSSKWAPPSNPKSKMCLCNISMATNQISITHFPHLFQETNEISQ